MGVLAPAPCVYLDSSQSPEATTSAMESDLNAAYDACNNFNNKLKDAINGLIGANSDRKSEIEGLRGDHETLRKDHDAFVTSMERLTLKTKPGKRRLLLSTAGLKPKMILAKLRLPTSITSRTLRTTVAKLTLQPSTSDWKQNLQPGTLKMLPSTKELMKKLVVVRLLVPSFFLAWTHRMMTRQESLRSFALG